MNAGSQAALKRFMGRAQRTARIRGEVNVLVTNSAEMQALNRRFRHRDKTTDVLSFPSAVNGHLGDIAISVSLARQQSKRLGHTLQQELSILALHGLLHLAGYDHERDAGKMLRKERLLRHRFGLPLGLIERSAPQPRKRTPRP